MSKSEDFAAKKRVIVVKKNLTDPTASLSYSLGVSVVHFAMLVAMTQVEQVDPATLELI